MILSYHPLIEKDENRLCAGREPDGEDLAAICRARAVILPQGCYRSLYEMARKHCRHVFPHYEARFQYPGKIGQARLFEKTGVPVPKTVCFASVSDFKTRSDAAMTGYPLVFKFDWGGEGESVSRIDSREALTRALARAEAFEATGQRGFLLQEFIPTAGKSLRVVVIGTQRISYWRMVPDETDFLTGISSGGRIDREAHPEAQRRGRAVVADYCSKTGINLAGLDLLFRAGQGGEPLGPPLFLEINYFFGRKGIGGSAAYYGLLLEAVEHWLRSLDGPES
jgi:ribosomal protein S6--L-glutamate ligase